MLLTTAVARMLTRAGNRTPSMRLMATGAVIMLTGDLIYTTMSSTSEYTGGFVDSGFLMAYACWGAAALHPSMTRRPDTVLDVHRIGRTRLGILTAFVLIPPGLLFFQGAGDPAAIAWVSLGIGAVVLCLLVVMRMWGLVRQVKLQASRLGDLAMLDPLTGLANRRAFEEALGAAVATGTPTVLLLDLNGFKAVNDRFGHAVGDELLAAVAARISGAIPAGAVAARMGGDEFAVLLPTDVGDDLAARLRTAIHQPIHAGGQDLLVGASIGIAGVIDPVSGGGPGGPVSVSGGPASGAVSGGPIRDGSVSGGLVSGGGPGGPILDGQVFGGGTVFDGQVSDGSVSGGLVSGDRVTDPVEVLRRADVAMYAAKADGGRHRRYTADLDTSTDEEARLGAELRTALDRRQFHLVYQPIVELPTGKVLAVESLVRWWHPDRGYIAPDVFIPVAERSGLIVELGEWILRTACRQFAEWWRHGVAPYRFGVNVSARQLAEPGFVSLVAEILAETGVHPARLIVEVTETAVFGGGAAVRAVHELTELGVEIALDDFGTGHSSLGLLQTLPVRILKVDKSFVENVTMAGRHAVIATSLIHVANGLGLVAIAEGVETAEQAAELYRLGYRRAQGYHFGRPEMARPLSDVATA
ncbi:putative bifunctional diguanylate cyclase/phosphodiesterase [Actinoplanes sp. CA-252034]|uniref:putative bifunctional diguanylate cyclase/phosphodiesterase n=1 Tax=Actinoplanes sp. CA-252034 TaxID=3239906 RepID=UPI003D980A66